MVATAEELNDSLRKERSWIEVAGGLSKVLWGYAALIMGWFVASAFFYACYAPILAHKQVKIEHVWYFYIGAAVLKLTGLASWGLILAGQWRCLMNSSERNGARWVIFFCMTCVVMGPVLHMLAWFGGLSTPIRWTGGPAALQGMKIKFTMMGLYLMSASLITSALYKLSFWYYLMTVASCMGARRARVFVAFFMVAVVAMAGTTYYWLTGGLHPNRFEQWAPWIAGGWVGIALYWVLNIVVVKTSIELAVASVYNPMKDVPTHYQLANS